MTLEYALRMLLNRLRIIEMRIKSLRKDIAGGELEAEAIRVAIRSLNPDPTP